MRTRDAHACHSLLLLLLPVVGFFSGCSPAPRVVLVDRGPQAYYQTAFPVHDTSEDLARAFRSMKQVSYTAEYVTYLFSWDEGVTEDDVLTGNVAERALTSFSEVQSKAGTATILGRAVDRITLLTTWHVVHMPAIEVEFFEEPEITHTTTAPRRVASASYRTAEMGGLIQHPDLGPFEVLARDEVNDLAILGLALREWSSLSDYPPLNLGSGEPQRLSWGSFVYVLGFPRGYPMVTRAIVSDPNRDGRGAFFTDGLWNEGISGGMILAIRGDTGALEPVGIARAGAADREIRLLPDTTGVPLDGNLIRPYEGRLFVESFLRIQYGITLSVSMTLIDQFVARHRDAIRSRGFPIS